MHIKNETFYHVHTVGKHSALWKPDAIINITKKQKNPWLEFYDLNKVMTDMTNGQGIKYFFSALDNFVTEPSEYRKRNCEKMLQIAHKVIREQCIYIREVIFEEVRKNYFPDLPSRKSGIWLCAKDSVEFWWNALSKKKTLFMVSATGILHRADQKNLIADTVGHDMLRYLAFQYWAGIEGTTPEKEELLFEGVVKVLKSYDTLDVFRDQELAE